MSNTNTLEDLYNQHTGNVSDKWSLYLPKYEELFCHIRERPVRLLEVGVQNGGSLEIWRKYFPDANLILGCDINPTCDKINFEDKNINILVGDINKPKTLEQITEYTQELDIVIDDGSHTSHDIINTFCNLFPKIRENGSYIIEDLHCSYWSQFEGGLYHTKSSMNFFKSLTDVLNFEHWGREESRVSYMEHFGCTPTLSDESLSEIHSIEFSNSMCIIKKKSKNQNLLGIRRVVGTKETVSPVLHAANTYNTPPVQKLQIDGLKPHGALDGEVEANVNSKEKIIREQHGKIETLTAQINHLETELRRIQSNP
jgi:hypothetical protein